LQRSPQIHDDANLSVQDVGGWERCAAMSFFVPAELRHDRYHLFSVLAF
jgi:hypothetical protein